MTECKKILFISPQPFFQLRGSPIRVSFTLKALSELGYEVDLLTLPYGEDRHIEGVTIFRVPKIWGVKQITIGPSLGKIIYDIVLLFYSFRLNFKKKYSFIHTIEDAGLIGFINKIFFKKKIIFEKHSDLSSYKKNFIRNSVLFIYSIFEKIVVKNSNAVIGTGPKLAEQLKDIHSGSNAWHIFDIPSSLKESSPDNTFKIRNQLKKHSEEILVLYVGSFAIYQGIELLFSSIPIVINKNNQVRFVIVGGSEDEIKTWKEYLDKNNCVKNVEFLGKISPDDLPDYLSACDILLSPRISGLNTPLKLLDYMKAGKAILATDFEANRQFLNNDNSYLVNPNTKDFANGVIFLVNNPALREKISSNGVKSIEGKYNFREFKKLLQNCYDSL